MCLRMLLCAERSATVGRETRHEGRVVSLSGVCGVIECDVVSGGWSGVRRYGFKHATFPVHLGELVSFVPGTHLTASEVQPMLPKPGGHGTSRPSRSRSKRRCDADASTDKSSLRRSAVQHPHVHSPVKREIRVKKEPVDPEEERAAADADLRVDEYQRLTSRGGVAKQLRGLNIQRPWARLILAGIKTIEARSYALKGYTQEDLWIIETPGKAKSARGSTMSAFGKITGLQYAKSEAKESKLTPFASSIIGVVRFGSSFQYSDLAQWRADEPRHRIPRNSTFDWLGKTPMFGWRVVSVKALAEPQKPPARKGIIGCKPLTRVALYSTDDTECGAEGRPRFAVLRENPSQHHALRLRRRQDKRTADHHHRLRRLGLTTRPSPRSAASGSVRRAHESLGLGKSGDRSALRSVRIDLTQ